jgi:hypothetical protein
MLNQLPKILDRMPKWVWFALGLVFLVGFALLVGYSSAQPPRYPQAHSTTYATEHESVQDISAQIVARYTKVLAWFTGILALATMGLGASTIIQINLARSEFLSGHRPKIRIKHVWLISEMLVYDEPFTVRVVCVNRGRSDAFMVDYNIGFFVVRRGRGIPVDPQIPAVLISGKLPSGISLPFPDISHQITHDEEIGIRNQMADLFCLGSVHYKDGAGRIRTTGFCRKLDLTSTILRVGRLTFRPVEDTEFEYTD